MKIVIQSIQSNPEMARLLEVEWFPLFFQPGVNVLNREWVQSAKSHVCFNKNKKTQGEMLKWLPMQVRGVISL